MPPKKRASTEENGASEPKLNKTSSDLESLNFDCSKKSKEGKEHNFKITTWNVDGLRACIKKGGLDFLEYEKPDVLCLQEIKCSVEKLPPEIKVKCSNLMVLRKERRISRMSFSTSIRVRRKIFFEI